MRRLFSFLVLVALGGCATVSPDRGLSAVQELAQARLGPEIRLASSQTGSAQLEPEVRERLAQPLTVETAVQVALLNNRGLQATYAELGIAESELVQASRLPNPSWTYRRAGSGDTVSIESVVTLQFVEVLTLPLRSRIEARRFEQTKLTVADAVLRIAADTRKAYFQAVAAEQSVRYLGQVREAAEAGAELARGMAQAGNWPKLAHMREQLFYADAVAQLARARQTARGSRETLTRLLGLWGADAQFRLPERLPDLPKDAPALADLEPYALAERLDLRVARAQTESVASTLGLSRATRFVNVLELGPAWVKEAPEPTKRGYEISLSVPLFDWGDARIAKAEATYMQAVERLAQAAIDARSEVREAHGSYLTAYELAKHYRDEVVPLRKRIADENLLRYNGMLISVFELLADTREQVLAVNASIDALKDFWIAETELRQVLGGTLPAGALTPSPK